MYMNFEKAGPIHPGRGLRQGDPLHTCSSWLLKALHLLFIKRSLTEIFTVSKYVEGHPLCPIYYLQMIAFFFAGLLSRRQ
jgi:hypothetical protein